MRDQSTLCIETHGNLQAIITTVETNFNMLSTHKDLARFTESPGGEITKPKHSSTTRIICLTHNRSSSFRPKQVAVVPRLTFIPIAKASIFNTSTSNYSRKNYMATIFLPFSYIFPTIFLKTIWLFFPSHRLQEFRWTQQAITVTIQGAEDAIGLGSMMILRVVVR